MKSQGKLAMIPTVVANRDLFRGLNNYVEIGNSTGSLF